MLHFLNKFWKWANDSWTIPSKSWSKEMSWPSKASNSSLLLSTKKNGNSILFATFMIAWPSLKLLFFATPRQKFNGCPRKWSTVTSLSQACTDQWTRKKETELWVSSDKETLEFWSQLTSGVVVLMFSKFLWSSTMIFLLIESFTFTESVVVVVLDVRELPSIL